MYMLIALSSSICCLSSPSHLRLLNGQAKVRYCHNAVAMFRGVTEVPTGHTYVQTIGTRDRARHVASRRICPHIHILCMPVCVPMSARPLSGSPHVMTCIALSYLCIYIWQNPGKLPMQLYTYAYNVQHVYIYIHAPANSIPDVYSMHDREMVVSVVSVICALVVVDSAAADLDLNVFYLEEENYSAVRLTCTGGGLTVTNAEFLKDGDLITSTSNLVTVTNIGSGEISFTFTQQQEGMFSCRSGGGAGGDESEKIGLAGTYVLSCYCCCKRCKTVPISHIASPAMNYDGVERLRNITFPTPESSRDINLSCPIRPGALSERYSARWVSSVPGTGEFRVIPNSNRYDTTVSHASSSLDQYECQIMITHCIGQDVAEIIRSYDGPLIVIKRNGENTDTGNMEYSTYVWMIMISFLSTILSLQYWLL